AAPGAASAAPPLGPVGIRNGWMQVEGVKGGGGVASHGLPGNYEDPFMLTQFGLSATRQTSGPSLNGTTRWTLGVATKSVAGLADLYALAAKGTVIPRVDILIASTALNSARLLELHATGVVISRIENGAITPASIAGTGGDNEAAGEVTLSFTFTDL